MIQKLARTSVISFLFIFLFAQNSFSLSIVRFPPEKKVATTKADYLKASVFVTLSAREFAAVSGTRLNFFQRIYFKAVQRQVKRDLRKNPDLLITNYFDNKTHKFKFDALWFVIGAFIGPIGVLLSYYSHQQKNGPNKKDRTTSAWLGFAFFLLWFGFIFIF